MPEKRAGKNIERLYSPNAVARMVGLDSSTVRHYARTRNMPGVYAVESVGMERLVFSEAFVAAMFREFPGR